VKRYCRLNKQRYSWLTTSLRTFSFSVPRLCFALFWLAWIYSAGTFHADIIPPWEDYIWVDKYFDDNCQPPRHGIPWARCQDGTVQFDRVSPDCDLWPAEQWSVTSVSQLCGCHIWSLFADQCTVLWSGCSAVSSMQLFLFDSICRPAGDATELGIEQSAEYSTNVAVGVTARWFGLRPDCWQFQKRTLLHSHMLATVQGSITQPTLYGQCPQTDVHRQTHLVRIRYRKLPPSHLASKQTAGHTWQLTPAHLLLSRRLFIDTACLLQREAAVCHWLTCGTSSVHTCQLAKATVRPPLCGELVLPRNNYISSVHTKQSGCAQAVFPCVRWTAELVGEIHACSLSTRHGCDRLRWRWN